MTERNLDLHNQHCKNHLLNRSDTTMPKKTRSRKGLRCPLASAVFRRTP